MLRRRLQFTDSLWHEIRTMGGMLIAIPHENGRLHGHFGGCREFALVQVDPDKKVARHIEVMPAPEHRPGAFPRWLREQGVTTVIVGGIGRRALDIFAHHGIAVCAGWPEARVEVLVAAYLGGQLTRSPEGCEPPRQSPCSRKAKQ